MLRSFGLLRPVLRRGRADLPMVAAAWLLLLCATTLIAAAAVYGDAVANGALRRAVGEAPPGERAVVVRMSRPAADLPSLHPLVAPELDAAMAPVGGEVALVARSGALEWPDAGEAGEPGEETREGAALATFEGLERHAALHAGSWPAAGASPVQATLSEGAAAGLGLAVGDRVRLVAPLGRALEVELEVVGIWRPEADDPYWLGSRLEIDGTETRGSFTAWGPFSVTTDDLVALLGRGTLDVQWRGLPDEEGLRVDRVDPLRTGITGLRQRLGAVLPARASFTVDTALPESLGGLSRSLLVSRSGVLLLTIQFALLAVYAILLVAGMLIERRRAEVMLLRSRGASTGHIVGMAFAEAAILALPAILFAPFLATGVVQLLGSVGPLADTGILTATGVTAGALTAALVAGLAGVAVLTLPSLSAGGPLAGVRAAIARQTNRTLAQRLGLDLVLVVLAGIALWQLRLYGAPLTRQAQGVLGVDPLLVAAPSIGLLAGGVLATRIVPRAAEVAQRLLEGRRGLVPPLAARQLARRPLRYTRSALLLLLAAALGTFAAADAATWSRSQADRAAYEAAADLRASRDGPPRLPSWAQASGHRAIDGVEAASAVLVESFDVGRSIRNGRLLALEPGSAARVMTPLPAESEPALSDLLHGLAAARPDPASLEIPGRPRRLAVVLDARLEDDLADDLPLDYAWPGVGVAVVVQDADGRVHRLPGPRASSTGGEQRLEIPISSAVGATILLPAWPLRLVAVELDVRAPDFVPAVGSLELLAVEASDAVVGDAWERVAFVADDRTIAWERAEVQQQVPYRPPATAPGRILFGSGPGRTPAVFGGPGQSSATFRLEVKPDRAEPVPAIVGTRVLEATGTRVGDRLDVSVAGQPIPIEIVGSAELFPPLDAAVPFIVLDRVTLEATRFERTSFPGSGDEWWLAVGPGREGDVTSAVRGGPFGADEVIGREALAERYRTDPVPLGVIGALGLGAAAALVFAAIGFVVSASVSASERVGEFALLRALGLSTRQLSAWLSVENACLLLFGLLGGTALGVLLAWLVLPFSTLTETGERVVPPPVVVIPWDGLLPIHALGAGLLVVAILVAVRQLQMTRISSVLRARDE